MSRILLVDGNSIMNRAFYGVPLLTNKDGEYTNAIYGFLNIVLKIQDDEKADGLVVAFDLKGGTFRNEIFKDYKAGRRGMPDELRPQMKQIKEVLNAMNVCVREEKGYEADDIIGTLSSKLALAGEEVIVLSGDRDLLQLTGDGVTVIIPKTSKGTTTYHRYTPAVIMENMGVSPSDLIEVKGLMGDNSDNIPGVPGVGEKTALKLIKEYGNIEKVYENRDKLSKKLGENIGSFYEQALMSRKLGRIILDMDMDASVDEFLVQDMFNEVSKAYFVRFQLNSFLNKFDFDMGIEDEKEEEVEIELADYKSGQIGDEASEIYYVSLYDETGIYFMYTLDKKKYFYVTSEVARAFFDEVYAREDLIKYTHDLKKQLLALAYEGEIKPENIYDLTLVNYILDPSRKDFSLHGLLTNYSFNIEGDDEFFGKGKSKKTLLELGEEAVKERLTRQLRGLSKIREEVFNAFSASDKTEELYFNIELPLLFVLYKMEKRGIRVDGEALKLYSAELEQEIARVAKEVYEITGEEFNIASPKQVGEMLFDKMDLPFAKKTKTGYSTSAEVLEKIATYHPIGKLILEYRKLSKLKSTYTDSLYGYIEDDGRIHSSFNQMVTSTGRISSTDPNLQNIPIRTEMGRKIRKVFVADEGKVFIDADYSQIELRILAHLSGDETMLNAFKNGDDIHTITASNVFHVPLDEVDANMRRKAKAVNFGIIYGISAFGLTRDLDIPMNESKEYIEKYFAKYGKIKDFLDKSVADAKKKGYAETIFARKRNILELKSKNFMQRSFGERIAMNTPIQGSAADIIKIAMIEVEKRLLEGGYEARLILQIHDELIVEAPEREKDEVKELLIKTMEDCVELSVPLLVEAGLGNNWDDSH